MGHRLLGEGSQVLWKGESHTETCTVEGGCHNMLQWHRLRWNGSEPSKCLNESVFQYMMQQLFNTPWDNKYGNTHCLTATLTRFHQPFSHTLRQWRAWTMQLEGSPRSRGSPKWRASVRSCEHCGHVRKISIAKMCSNAHMESVCLMISCTWATVRSTPTALPTIKHAHAQCQRMAETQLFQVQAFLTRDRTLPFYHLRSCLFIHSAVSWSFSLWGIRLNIAGLIRAFGDEKSSWCLIFLTMILM